MEGQFQGLGTNCFNFAPNTVHCFSFAPNTVHFQNNLASQESLLADETDILQSGHNIYNGVHNRVTVLICNNVFSVFYTVKPVNDGYLGILYLLLQYIYCGILGKNKAVLCSYVWCSFHS